MSFPRSKSSKDGKWYDDVIMPQELKDKLDGFAIRVPVPDVSFLDMSLELEQDTDVDFIHNIFTKESKGKMKNIIDVSWEPLVSIDYIGSSFSAVIDCLSTKVIDKKMLKLFAWYDNEYGYSCRVLDLLDYLCTKIIAAKPI